MKKLALAVVISWLASNTAWAKSVEDLPNTQVYDSCSEGPRVWHVICKASEGHHKRSALEEKLLDELFQYFGYVASAYTHVLEDLPMDSPQQKAMIAEQKAYLDGMDDCGNDLKCILRAEKRRLDELNALRRKLEKPLPDAEMQRLTKGWKIGRESLYDRLVEGFSIYPLRQVTLADGRTVQWGFAPHAAMVQSVAVLGPDGHLQALAAANDLYRSQLPSTVKSVPEFRVFLPDAQRSSAVLGILRSWAVASSLGFSVDCAAKDRGACNKALVSLPPPTVYDLRCLQKRLVAACAVPGDGAKGSLQEVSLFWQ